MIPFSACSRWLKRWSGAWVRRPRARRRAAALLESLEQRLNLSAVLVVETMDAYWLIEDSTFDATSTSAEIDAASEWFTSADEAEEWISPWLPDSVVPVAADGSLLNNIEADMVWSLLGDLWVGAADFYAQDVLAMTFFADTTMDAIIDGGLFDGSFEDDQSSNTENLLAEEFFTSDVFANEDPNSQEVLADFEESTTGVQSLALDDHVDEQSNATDTAALAALISPKVDHSLMSIRAEADAVVLADSSRSISDHVSPTMVAFAARNEAVPAIRKETNSRQFAEDLVNEPIEVVGVANSRTTNQSVSSAGLANVDSFFARLPAALQVGIVRSPLARLLRPERDATAAADSNLRANDDPQELLSYSQWASLIGVVGLSAGRWYQGREDDRQVDDGRRRVGRTARKCPVAF